MIQQDIQHLIRQYLQGTLSEQDRQKLLQWYRGLPDRQAARFLDHFDKALDTFSPQDLDELEQKLRASARSQVSLADKKPASRLSIPPLYLKIAASVLLLLALGTAYYFKSLPANSIRQLAGGTLEERTDFGQVKEVRLPDGSVVMLNAGTTLQYDRNLGSGQTREVYLAGEAYFQVSHDATHPFIVHTPKGVSTQVLGTSFNINTYRNPQEVEVAVLTGKVAVNAGEKRLGVLTKTQQLTYNTATTQMRRQQARQAEAWTQGKLIFDGEQLGQVVAELERAYDIRIYIAKGVSPSLRCSGKFDLSQKPEDILRVLSILHDLHLQSTNKSFIISP
ncbi:MAG: FecR family protein [Adhaeribacter sp.]